MGILEAIAEGIAATVGSLAAAFLLCWLLWRLLRIVRHPAWGPPLVGLPLLLVLAGVLPGSPIIVMTLLFAAVAAVPFWSEGRRWRRQWDENPGSATDRPAPPVSAPPDAPQNLGSCTPRFSYPAIIGCIVEDRAPTREETKMVAIRVLRETNAMLVPKKALGTALLTARASLMGDRQAKERQAADC